MGLTNKVINLSKWIRKGWKFERNVFLSREFINMFLLNTCIHVHDYNVLYCYGNTCFENNTVYMVDWQCQLAAVNNYWDDPIRNKSASQLKWSIITGTWLWSDSEYRTYTIILQGITPRYLIRLVLTCYKIVCSSQFILDWQTSSFWV